MDVQLHRDVRSRQCARHTAAPVRTGIQRRRGNVRRTGLLSQPLLLGSRGSSRNAALQPRDRAVRHRHYGRQQSSGLWWQRSHDILCVGGVAQPERVSERSEQQVQPCYDPTQGNAAGELAVEGEWQSQLHRYARQICPEGLEPLWRNAWRPTYAAQLQQRGHLSSERAPARVPFPERDQHRGNGRRGLLRQSVFCAGQPRQPQRAGSFRLQPEHRLDATRVAQRQQYAWSRLLQ